MPLRKNRAGVARKQAGVARKQAGVARKQAGVAPKQAPVSERVAKQAHLSNASTSRIQHSLSSMPIEIKDRIVYWLQKIDICDDTARSADYGAEVSKISSTNELPSAPPEYALGRRSDDGPFTECLPTDAKSLPLAIKALCLVDRTFYELCRPRIWKQLDFEGCTIEKLEQILTDIIPRHADCVRSISWRVSFPELIQFKDVFESRDLKWDAEKRSTILLSILQACPRLVDLDLDFHDLRIPLVPIQIFIEPFAKLTSLTTLSLSAPSEWNPFSEESLVTFLTDLHLLESFTCSCVSARFDAFDFDSPGPAFQSPLARRLSTMAHLQLLDLRTVVSMNASWSEFTWVGPLEKLALRQCHDFSIEGLLQLTKTFASTLRELELDEVPFYHDGGDRPEFHIYDMAVGKYNFHLPKLSVLCVPCCMPISFLRAFENCKSLVELAFVQVTCMLTKDLLNNLIKDAIWPDLKRLKMPRRGIVRHWSSGDLKDLKRSCLALGIEVNIEQRSDDKTRYEIV